MQAKIKEQEKAIQLRKQGLSYKEILEHIRVSKGSLSYWLRDIELTDEQQQRIRPKKNNIKNQKSRKRLPRNQIKWDYIQLPGYHRHPNAHKNGVILEHRLIMSKFLGRPLKNNEVIHHKNNNGKDNRIKNLEILDRKAHNYIHSEIKKITLICAYCNKIFKKRPSYAKYKIKHGQKKFYCSKKCASEALIKYSIRNKNFPTCTIICSYCNKPVIKNKYWITQKKRKGQTNFYCNRKCMFDDFRKRKLQRKAALV